MSRTEINKALGGNKSAAEIDDEIALLLEADQITQERVQKVDKLGRDRSWMRYRLSAAAIAA